MKYGICVIYFGKWVLIFWFWIYAWINVDNECISVENEFLRNLFYGFGHDQYFIYIIYDSLAIILLN